MGHEHAGHYKAKHPQNVKPSTELINQVSSILKDSTITCHDAHKLAEKLQISPTDIGVAIDFCEARIIKCQLGLFGYSPDKRIVKPLALNEAAAFKSDIRAELENSKLSCIKAWELAKKTNRGKLIISNAAETFHIKICNCQLGAF